MSDAALLIGSSDGIGLALTRRLLERGFAVTGISKRPSPVSHEAYRHVVLDVSAVDYGARLDAALPPGRIRLCVYCAGIGDHFAMDALKRDVATFQVNLLGLVTTVERILPRMAKMVRPSSRACPVSLTSARRRWLRRTSPRRPA
jgi:NAD(P)-dependent dehydrogenase (short-subunit alcohol dehydrogenase family)